MYSVIFSLTSAFEVPEKDLRFRSAAYDCLLYRQVKIIDTLPVMVYTLPALLSLCSILDKKFCRKSKEYIDIVYMNWYSIFVNWII